MNMLDIRIRRELVCGGLLIFFLTKICSCLDPFLPTLVLAQTCSNAMFLGMPQLPQTCANEMFLGMPQLPQTCSNAMFLGMPQLPQTCSNAIFLGMPQLPQTCSYSGLFLLSFPRACSDSDQFLLKSVLPRSVLAHVFLAQVSSRSRLSCPGQFLLTSFLPRPVLAHVFLTQVSSCSRLSCPGQFLLTSFLPRSVLAHVFLAQVSSCTDPFSAQTRSCSDLFLPKLVVALNFLVQASCCQLDKRLRYYDSEENEETKNWARFAWTLSWPRVYPFSHYLHHRCTVTFSLVLGRHICVENWLFKKQSPLLSFNKTKLSSSEKMLGTGSSRMHCVYTCHPKTRLSKDIIDCFGTLARQQDSSSLASKTPPGLRQPVAIQPLLSWLL